MQMEILFQNWKQLFIATIRGVDSIDQKLNSIQSPEEDIQEVSDDLLYNSFQWLLQAFTNHTKEGT